MTCIWVNHSSYLFLIHRGRGFTAEIRTGEHKRKGQEDGGKEGGYAPAGRFPILASRVTAIMGLDDERIRGEQQFQRKHSGASINLTDHLRRRRRVNEHHP